MRDNVVVIGSGMMGSGIGAMAALAGNPTVLVDVDEQRVQAGLKRANDCIITRMQNELNTAAEAVRAKLLLSASTDMEQAVSSARLVIEAIVEKLDAKQNLFAQLDRMLPEEVPICSNTSGLRITEISALCTRPERCFTTHFWLPAHLTPLVEVVMGDRSSPEMGKAVVEELRGWKKTPVLVRKDLPGQLANRVFQAIIREAISIVASGVASAEDVDAAISCMAMRFPEWGPLTHLDAIGLELGLSVQDAVLPSISSEQAANDLLRTLVDRGETGAKAGKGFYDWSERDIDVIVKKRDAFLVEAVKAKDRIEREAGA